MRRYIEDAGANVDHGGDEIKVEIEFHPGTHSLRVGQKLSHTSTFDRRTHVHSSSTLLYIASI